MPDLRSARLEAIRFCGASPAERPEHFWNAGEWMMRVAGEVAPTLFELRFLATDAAAVRTP